MAKKNAQTPAEPKISTTRQIYNALKRLSTSKKDFDKAIKGK